MVIVMKKMYSFTSSGALCNSVSTHTMSYVTANLKAQLKELWPGKGSSLSFIRKSGWKKKPPWFF